MQAACRLAAAALLSGMAACANAPAGPVGSPLNKEIYVVGRIELVPPLGDKEQELKSLGSGRQRQRGYLFFSDRLIDISSIGPGAARHAAHIGLNKDFVIRRKAFDEMYYSGVNIWLRAAGGMPDYFLLPGGVSYKVAPGDKAIYIGTLRYHRDIYNSITKIEYVDDYQRAVTSYRKETGNAVNTLRKVAPQQVKQQ